MNFNFEENDTFALVLGLQFRIISCERNVYGYYLYTKATIEICSFSPCIDLNFLSNRKIQSCTIHRKSLVILFVERSKPANTQEGG